MNKNRNDLEFGLKFEIPENAPAGWGARAIQEGSSIDILYDRQSVFGVDEKTMRLFLDVFNNGFFEQMRTAYAEAYKKGELRGDKEGVVTLIDNSVLAVKADTRGSYGYVYLCAYLKPSDDVSLAVNRLESNYDANNSEQIKWSGSFPVPNVGDKLKAAYNDQFKLGDCVVVRLTVDHGFVHAWVLPLAPSAKYKKDRRVGKSGWSFTNFAGIECKPVTVRNQKEKSPNITA